MEARPRIVRGAPGLIEATARTAVISGSAKIVGELALRHPSSFSSTPSDLGSQLEDICRLKRDGFLTDLEFAAAKARLLGLA